MAEESLIVLPEPFTVLQGMQGDGMWNTIDSVPIELEGDEDFHHVVPAQEQGSDGVVVDYDSLASSSGEQPPSQQTIHQSPLATLDPMLASTNMPPLCLNPLTSTTTTSCNMTTTQHRNTSLPERDSFIVVSEEDPDNTTTIQTQRAIDAWNHDCRVREERQRHEWLAQQQSSHFSPTNITTTTTTDNNDDWWQSGGRLKVFDEIPIKLPNGTIVSSVQRLVSPGVTLVGIDILYLDMHTLQPISSRPRNEHPKGISQQVQLLKLQDHGYIVFSVDGYCFLGPSLPSRYLSPNDWIWKVTYVGGAFVREGLELHSRHIATLPYGSFIRISRKTISADGGLSRLWVHAVLFHDEGATPVEGWISEYLNPTSTTGERGPIVQPVPFPVPALYKVTLREGALIRSDVELSSKQIGHAPFGALLSIVGRAFSEHPQDQCIERLKLAGNGGWVSVRLNEMPPDDVLVFEFQDVDGRFDPDHPGLFHLAAQAGVHKEVNPEFEGADLSSIDESNESTTSSISVIRGGVATDGPLRHGFSEGNCIACLSQERNATIVHGETGHIACCLVCARILKAQGKDCPVCRLPIDSVIQHFWA